MKDAAERNRLERIQEKRFNKIIVYFDADQRNDKETIHLLEKWFQESAINIHDDIEIGKWINSSIRLLNSTAEIFPIKIFTVVLPPNSNGALETFLLNSLRNNTSEEALVVDKARLLIDEIPDDPFLPKKRYREKASLGSALSIFSPDWVFGETDERLTSIKWEEYVDIQQEFKIIDLD